MKYLFKSNTTMKKHNMDKYWIMSDIIPVLEIEADTLNKAIESFADIVNNKYLIEISNNAIKHKQNMYIDSPEGSKQTGYVLTGRTDFENNGQWVSQYIDIWTEIKTLTEVF